MHKKQTHDAEYRRPLLILSIGIVLTTAVLGIMSWFAWSTHRHVSQLVDEDLRLQELRGTILHLDEVLSMSAQMAATTGDWVWEERYRAHEPLLHAAFKEANRLAPTPQRSEAMLQTDEAKLKLIAMAYLAFELVRQGKSDAARLLLFSKEHDTQKAIYARGMGQLAGFLEIQARAKEQAIHRRATAITLLGGIAAISLFVVWAVIFIAFQRHFKKSVLAKASLVAAHRDMELQIETRTHELAQSNRKLQREITDGKWAEAARNTLLHDRGERVKELSCMYAVAPSIRQRATLSDIFQDVASLLPPGWQSPGITRGKVLFDDQEYVSEPFQETAWKLSADIDIGGQCRGSVEVYYLEKQPEADEGPFLKEERHLIDGITRTLSEGVQCMEAEAELRGNEQKFRAITTAAQDAIVMMDHEGKAAFWNDAAERIFGWTEKEIMGRPLHETIVPVRYRDARSKWFPAYHKPGAEALPGRLVEVPALCKDGTEIPIELSLSTLRLDEQWCTVGLARDISKRRENERSQARLKAAIEAATETIVITDTNGIIQYANPAFERNTGYACAEAMGMNSRFLNSGKHDQAFYRNLWGTISQGKVWVGHFVNKKKDGTLIHEDATISPIKDDQGGIINYVAVKRDVTKQRLMESQLQQAQKLESIGQLAAGIAHEINTPIQYVGDNTRFVRDNIEQLLVVVEAYAAQLDPEAEARC